MPSDSLIQQFGPIIILAYGVYYLLPNLVAVINQSTQSRAAVAQAPYDIVKTVLNERNQQNDMIAIELIGMRATLDRLEERQEQHENTLKQFAKMFEEFVKSHKESK